MTQYVIGIDPGLSGAIALVCDGQYAEVWDMPTMGRGSGNKQQINAAEVGRILRGCPPCAAWIEQVGAMPGQGVSSMFNFGKAAGAALGALGALQIPVAEVTPVKWKREFGLIGKEKDMARTVAIQRMPSAPLSLKKHCGRADALLIALYGWRNSQG
jgi:crossover junction endodeoxyribonuclease RuvC